MRYYKTDKFDGTKTEITMAEARSLLERNYCENVCTFEEMLETEGAFPCLFSVLEIKRGEKWRAVKAKEAYKIMDRLGLDYSGNDGITYYATDDEETSVYEFCSRKEREDWLKVVNK